MKWLYIGSKLDPYMPNTDNFPISQGVPEGVEILPVCFFLYNFVMKIDIKLYFTISIEKVKKTLIFFTR